MPSTAHIVAFTGLLVALAGCVTNPKSISLKPVDAAAIGRIQVLQSVSETQVYTINTPMDTTGVSNSTPSGAGPAATIFANLIAATLIQSGNRSEQVDPLLTFTRSVDFATPFRKAFGETLRASDWLRVGAISAVGFPANEAERSTFVDNAAGDSALFSDTTYRFSGDYRRVFVSTTVEIRANARRVDPVLRTTYLFCSEPAGDPADSLEAYLAHWSANDNARLRSTLAQGTAETMRMLRLGLLVRPTPSDAAAHPADLSLVGCGMPGSLSGSVLAEDATRQVIRADSGDIYSMPRAVTDAVKSTHRADAGSLRKDQ